MRSYMESAGVEFSGLVVEYEQLFDSEPSVRETVANQIAEFCGISDSTSVSPTQVHPSATSRGGRPARHRDPLESLATRHVLLHADTSGYHRLVEDFTRPISRVD